MLNIEPHFIQFVFLVALGFISGKFISTSLIQIIIWERVNDLGVKPPLISAALIYLRQTFCGWNSELPPRCRLISLMTSLLFVTFWIRYGINSTFIFCCIYSLFAQIFLFSWLDKRGVPEVINSSFIACGIVAVFFIDQNRIFISVFVSILYFVFKCFNDYTFSGSFHKVYFKNLSFIFSLVIWFGLLPSIICIFVAYGTGKLISIQKGFKNIKYNHELLNPIMCVLFFIYALFKFPSAL